MNEEITTFAQTNFRNRKVKFGVKTDDRRRHFYVIGKTGSGKTTLLENMVVEDILAGHGVGVVDPHGDFAEKLLALIPENRIGDVVYFNPADTDFPFGFNPLEQVRDEHYHIIASSIMGVFKKIWPDVWSARMEYILNNSLLSLLE
jgi:DNA helicase HerA-like ATPase